MNEILSIVANAYTGYARYLVHEITTPSWHNYFWWLIGISLLVWTLEIFVPWRKGQPIIRRDFWLDGWYMFFNFFVFSLIAYAAVSDVAVYLIRSAVTSITGITSFEWIDVRGLPGWLQLVILFLARDFIQWNIHRLLHAYPWLWEFHKVHHSVEQMGFAAHLRFHWMETIVYRTIEYVPLAFFGFGLQDFFAVHIFALAVGHLNHANIALPIGPLKYIFNTPQMHIWHHARYLPPGRKGVNYGLTLSIWDWMFGQAYMPKNGRDIPLGFEGDVAYPHSFWSQMKAPFKR
ncbi:MAG: sterol desaturase family protein [Candidatus Kapabacteria bacterium]|nr:sterol desaturase family protein [Candidatus Kapabacteria bacterium]